MYKRQLCLANMQCLLLSALSYLATEIYWYNRLGDVVEIPITYLRIDRFMPAMYLYNLVNSNYRQSSTNMSIQPQIMYACYKSISTYAHRYAINT